MKKLGLALLLLASLGLAPAQAQNAGWPPPAGSLAFLCVYNSSLPTLTTGEDGFVQCDSSGRIVTSPGSVSTPSAIEVVDGTNGPAAVKPASTAPAATDPALVVALSPNSFGDPCASGVAKSSAAINVTATGTLQLIALSGTKAIYACGFAVTIPNTATTATSLKFVAGTGTNCASVTATLTGAFGSDDAVAVSANPTVISYGSGNASIFSGPSASELCTVVTGNSTLDIEGVLTYVQQ